MHTHSDSFKILLPADLNESFSQEYRKTLAPRLGLILEKFPDKSHALIDIKKIRSEWALNLTIVSFQGTYESFALNENFLTALADVEKEISDQLERWHARRFEKELRAI